MNVTIGGMFANQETVKLQVESVSGERGPQGEPGADGKPGVYIGTEAPEDPEVSVWIDPDGEASFAAQDSERLGGKAPEYYLQPRNLLDNSDFSNLIAQAGLNGAHGSTAYIADRWISPAASATQQNGYTTLSTTDKTGRITQRLSDALAGKTVTAAAKVSGNSIVYCGIYYSQNSVSKSIAVNVSAPNGIVMKSGTIPADAIDIEFRIYIAYTDGGGSCNVYWAALYEGAYTDDTLPPYVPKGYAAEMMECQRYYHLYATSAARPSNGLDCCPPMRISGVTQGTTTVDGETRYYNSADL